MTYFSTKVFEKVATGFTMLSKLLQHSPFLSMNKNDILWFNDVYNLLYSTLIGMARCMYINYIME